MTLTSLCTSKMLFACISCIVVQFPEHMRLAMASRRAPTRSCACTLGCIGGLQ